MKAERCRMAPGSRCPTARRSMTFWDYDGSTVSAGDGTAVVLGVVATATKTAAPPRKHGWRGRLGWRDPPSVGTRSQPAARPA